MSSQRMKGIREKKVEQLLEPFEIASHGLRKCVTVDVTFEKMLLSH